tara:strand:- start:26130 stop:27203 length:1074 start_codon:yes stop_codon:yes gene_type:complete
MKPNSVCIIGTHGLYANHGGFETLVDNLVENKKNDMRYIIFASKISKKSLKTPSKVKVIRLPLSASGIQGVIYDFLCILISLFYSRKLLLLGSQGMPLITLLKIFLKLLVIVNLDGIETRRSSFSNLARLYLKLCYYCSYKSADKIILDNAYFTKITPKSVLHKAHIISYGSKIDNNLLDKEDLRIKYPFTNNDYFISMGRAIEDNNLYELCKFFSVSQRNLVLISVLDKSDYGKKVLDEFKDCRNIFFINGLFDRKLLDSIRKNSKGYIHTHSLCGTAPSLVEAICIGCPIASFDAPQNRSTLDEEGFYFDKFDSSLEYFVNLSDEDLLSYKSSQRLKENYAWDKITTKYEDLFKT